MDEVSLTSQQPDDLIYLTAAGRRRLEAEVARYSAQVAAWRSSAPGELAVDDPGDAAERLIEADDLTVVQDLLAAAQAALARALPMPEGPDDGIVRLGSTVTIRESEGPSTFLVVDRAELDDGGAQGAADSAVGAGVLGRGCGD